MNNFFRIGQIVSFHGFLGYCKVLPVDYNKNRFLDLIDKTVYIVDNIIADDELIIGNKCFKIEDIKFLNKIILIKFYEYDNIEQVRYFKNKHIFINRKDAVSLLKNEYYINDLIGMDVIFKEKSIGVVEDVIFNKNQQILSIKNNDKIIYIPMFDEFIKNISIDERTIVVSIIEGMI